MSNQYYPDVLQDPDIPFDTDHLVFKLVKLLENANFDSERDRQEAKNSVAKVSSLLSRESANSPASHVEPNRAGGLAPWQVLRLQGYIDSRIDQYMSISELSEVVRLSSSHFARVFRKTFQETPHNYVLRRRVAHAKKLLNSTATPMHEVALECGFSDQAHLCKIFKRFVGETPASWRRYRQPRVSKTDDLCIARIA